LGVAVVVLLYSFICLFSGFFLLWLVWVHEERKSCKQHVFCWTDGRRLTVHTDVAMLGFFVTLHTLASVIQQIHTIVWWRDIKIDQWKNTVANAGDPELSVTGASTGLDLVLFYIRGLLLVSARLLHLSDSHRILLLQCRIPAGFLLVRSPAITCSRPLTLTRAVELANSIFQLRITRMYRFHASLVAKATAAALPIVQMMLLRFSNVKKSRTGFTALASGISAFTPLARQRTLWCD
jgi:hypothetical protein